MAGLAARDSSGSWAGRSSLRPRAVQDGAEGKGRMAELVSPTNRQAPPAFARRRLLRWSTIAIVGLGFVLASVIEPLVSAAQAEEAAALPNGVYNALRRYSGGRCGGPL